MVTLNILLICAALLMGTLGAGLIYTDNMMSLVGTGAEEEFQGISGEIDFSQGESENPNFQNVAALDAVDSTSTLRSDPMVQNILMLGSDKREGKGETGWRADTQIILSIDHRHKTLKMTSILRDTYVHIPGGHQDNRINTAFAYGGAPLAMKAIESNFGIKIDRYVTVNFRIFEKIVDIIGGIDLEISAGEAKEINNRACPFGHPPVSEGFVHLNGRQTLEYSRIRKIDDDFARTSRQRKVLELMLEHFRSLSLTQVNELLYKTLPLISTNLSQEEILSLCGQVGTLLKYPLETMSVPASGTWEGKNIRGMSVLVANMQENRRLMAQFIFESGLSKYYGNTYSGYTYGFGYGNGYGYSYYSTRIPEENSTGDGEGPHSDEAKTQ